MTIHIGNYENQLRNEKQWCTVLGFDPGETTGYCIASVHPNALFASSQPTEHLLYLETGQIDCVSKDLSGWFGVAHKHAGINMAGENAGISEMVVLANNQFPWSAIVIEDFIPDMRKMDMARHTLSPVRIMAGFSYGLSCNRTAQNDGRLGDERIFVQNRSMAKTTFTDDRLKNFGMLSYVKGHDVRHARDSLRHCLYFLRERRGRGQDKDFKRHLSWPHIFDDPAITVIEKKKRVPKEGEII